MELWDWTDQVEWDHDRPDRPLGDREHVSQLVHVGLGAAWDLPAAPERRSQQSGLRGVPLGGQGEVSGAGGRDAERRGVDRPDGGRLPIGYRQHRRSSEPDPWDELVDRWSRRGVGLQHQHHRRGHVEFNDINVEPDLRRGGLGHEVIADQKALSDQTGTAHHWTNVTNPDFFNQFDHWTDTWDHHGRGVYEYEPPQALPPVTTATRACPTCGDPLTGRHETFCPRCQWSEDNANLDSDPLSNPPDPTRELHRGIQASETPQEPPQAFARTAPTHRWSKWLQAVEPL